MANRKPATTTHISGGAQQPLPSNPVRLLRVARRTLDNAITLLGEGGLVTQFDERHGEAKAVVVGVLAGCAAFQGAAAPKVVTDATLRSFGGAAVFQRPRDLNNYRACDE